MLEKELIRQITLDLTGIKSVVGTPGEIRVAEKVYHFLNTLDYYAQHPDYLTLSDLREDTLGRKNVVALLKGEKGHSKDTVILIGHIDTVGVEDYGNIKKYATDPIKLQELLGNKKLNDDTLKDLASGDWMFGRGIFDMKAGVAAQMALLKKLSESVDQLEGNVVFVAVPDEEGNSRGMLSAVDELLRLGEENDLTYIAAVDTDYMSPRFPGDDKKYIYIGTVGKILPCFYVYGKETHVGQVFEGLDANLLASKILREVNLSFDLCDVVENEVTLPPISLRLQDLKSKYSVQTVNEAYLYFNYSTHSSQPDEVLTKMKTKAEKAFKNALHRLNDEYRSYCRAADIPFQEVPWSVQVLTFEELYSAVRAEVGVSIDESLDKLKQELLKKKPDDRIYSLRIVRELRRHWSNKNPVIIVFFAPPYYPHNYVRGKDENERKLLAAVNEAVAHVSTEHPYKFVVKKFYPYISDLSYCSISRESKVINALVSNMPGWNEIYSLPIESMQKLNVPVVNIGPYGKDAHKFTERVNMPYSFEVMPKILEKTVRLLLDR
jgi:arginine utilization protein RocB